MHNQSHSHVWCSMVYLIYNFPETCEFQGDMLNRGWAMSQAAGSTVSLREQQALIGEIEKWFCWVSKTSIESFIIDKRIFLLNNRILKFSEWDSVKYII